MLNLNNFSIVNSILDLVIKKTSEDNPLGVTLETILNIYAKFKVFLKAFILVFNTFLKF